MDSASLNATDQLGGRDATHPRVALADINAAIRDEYYCSGAQAACANPDPALPRDNPLHLLTLCILVLHNGFTVVGTSAPASPENFDPEKGRTFARDNAVRQIWPLMGFSLRDTLHRSGEVTGHDVAGIAARRMHDSDPEVRRLAASALTQAPDHPKV